MATDQIGLTGPAKSREQKATFEALIARQSAEVQKIARAARDLILQVLPEAIESVWVHQRTCGYGTGDVPVDNWTT